MMVGQKDLAYQKKPMNISISMARSWTINENQ